MLVIAWAFMAKIIPACLYVECHDLFLFSPVRILLEDGTEAGPDELGRIVCKLPLAPGTMSTLYKADQRFKETYFTQFPVSWGN